jgi:ABC-type Mn2+/Zn2+ transport system ATPase subunit
MSELLSFHDLVVGYGGTRVAGPFTSALKQGQAVEVHGRNGSGKSTFLKTVAGILPPLGGRIERMQKLRMGYVPQAATVSLQIPCTAEEFVMLGVHGAGASSGSVVDASSLFHSLHLEEVRRTPVTHLSGGQRQRLLLIRALATKPDLLIFDEGFSSADDQSVKLIGLALSEYCRRESGTLLYVTHQPALIPDIDSGRFLIDGGPVEAGAGH